MGGWRGLLPGKEGRTEGQGMDRGVPELGPRGGSYKLLGAE